MLTHLETARLCRSLGLLLHSGIGLADGIFLLAQEETSGQKACLETIGTALDRGIPLSDAMETSKNLPPYVFHLVHIGEQTGRMEEALTALAEYYEEQERTRQQIRSAVAYPGLLFCLMLAVLLVLLVKVLPVFEQVYASLGTRMTGTAGAMLYLGQLAKGTVPVLAGFLLLLAAAGLAYRWNVTFREWLGRKLRNHFGDRSIARKFNNARFAQGLSMGFCSGLPLDAAAELAKSLLAEIPQAAQRCEICRMLLASGASIREAMEQGQFLSPAQSRMLNLGIRGGTGDQVIQTIARQMQEEARNELDAAVSRIEPAMVLTASLLVGMILLAVMLPLMDILSVLG